VKQEDDGDPMNDPYLKNLSKGLQYGLIQFFKDHPEFSLK
jgi:hypothetical protein